MSQSMAPAQDVFFAVEWEGMSHKHVGRGLLHVDSNLPLPRLPWHQTRLTGALTSGESAGCHFPHFPHFPQLKCQVHQLPNEKIHGVCVLATSYECQNL